jgi:hypothetical protein
MLLYQLQAVVSTIEEATMPYAFVQDVPANEEIYVKIRALLPEQAPGLQAHVVIKREGGLRYVEVWDDEASWLAFRDAHVEPAVDQVLASYGIPHDHSMVTTEPIDVIDVWCNGAV